MTETSIDGWVADGFGEVADVFGGSFARGIELGAAVAVYVGGKCVVDLWGGVADARTGEAWRRDTVVPVFSTTKGVTALCAHVLSERGVLDLDAPVAEYWPEFAQAGKGRLPVRWLLTHQAGLPYVDQDLTLDDLRTEQPVLEALARQTPLWEPGTSFAYHAVTFGPLVGEVIRRVTGKRLGQFFEDEIARPLGLRSWMALPSAAEVDIAHLERIRHPVPEPFASILGPTSTFVRAITLGGALPYDLVTGNRGDFNDRKVLEVEMGGSGMVSDARSLARVYAAAVGEVDGTLLLAPETVRAMSQVVTREIPYFRWPADLGPAHPLDFALGFAASESFGEGCWFGHGGAGGSLGLGALDEQIGFGYVMNRMDATAPDTRAADLVAAVRSCVGG